MKRKSPGEPTFSEPELNVQPKMIVPEVKRTSLIHKPISRRAVNLNSIEAMTPEDDHMVTGTFVNIECPGQTAKISGKYYKQMEYFSEVLKDNHKHTIPLSVARYINERICHDQHRHILDSSGNPVKSGSAIFRYKFIIEEHHKNQVEAA